MNRFVLIVVSALTLVLSACGTSEPLPLTENPPLEDETLSASDVEISVPTLEWPGCTLPALEPESSESSEMFQGCIFWGCIRYENEWLIE